LKGPIYTWPSADDGTEEAAEPIGHFGGGDADAELPQALRSSDPPVSTPTMAPVASSATPTATIAAVPVVTRNGRIGMAAPAANDTKLNPAAPAAVAEPSWTDTPDWDAIDSHASHLRRQY
jgi:hypothetical protein